MSCVSRSYIFLSDDVLDFFVDVSDCCISHLSHLEVHRQLMGLMGSMGSWRGTEGGDKQQSKRHTVYASFILFLISPSSPLPPSRLLLLFLLKQSHVILWCGGPPDERPPCHLCLFPSFCHPHPACYRFLFEGVGE